MTPFEQETRDSRTVLSTKVSVCDRACLLLGSGTRLGKVREVENEERDSAHRRRPVG